MFFFCDNFKDEIKQLLHQPYIKKLSNSIAGLKKEIIYGVYPVIRGNQLNEACNDWKYCSYRQYVMEVCNNVICHIMKDNINGWIREHNSC